MLFEKWLGHPLIQADNHIGLLAVMCISVAVAIWLEQKYKWASKLSGAIIALIFAMVMANIGIIPIASTLYDDIVWGYVVPIGIPLLLLQCNLKKIWSQTGPMLVVFLIGAVGTIVGALISFFVLKGAYVATGGEASNLAAVAAMMTGSYIGGGVNFAAMASQFSLQGTDIAGAATVADNLLMALYFFVLILFAGMRFFRKNFKHPHIDEVEAGVSLEAAQTNAAAFWGRKEISLKDIAINFAYAVAVVWVAQIIAGLFSGLVPENPNDFMKFIGGFFGSQYVWITTISVIVATFFEKPVAKMNGSQEIGTFLIYLFLFVIGVPANIYTVVTKAPLFLVLTTIMVICNMVFCFGAAKLFKFGLEDAIIASNANIGGPPSAAGMAISQGWAALVGPGMLMGVLGYVIGNYAGTLIGLILGA